MSDPAIVPTVPGPRMIFVTQLIDPADPVLGFVVAWVRALAARCDRLWVIANEVRAVPGDLDATVVSLGKESGKGKVARGLRYESALLRIVRGGSVDTLVAHMCPVYLNLATPITKAHRVRTLLWFAHPARHMSLRVADRLADSVISSLPGAYPGSREKVTYIGQGIDVRHFPNTPLLDVSKPLRLLMLNRLSPVKGIPSVLRAVARVKEAGVDVRLSIVGPASTVAESVHRDELFELVESCGIRDVVSFQDGVSPARVPDVIAGCHAVINATTKGSGDKTILEAMAAARPVILSNHVFAPLVQDLPVELTFKEGDASGLADRIIGLASSSAAVLNDVGGTLRHRVQASHSLDQWADRVVALSGGAR